MCHKTRLISSSSSRSHGHAAVWEQQPLPQQIWGVEEFSTSAAPKSRRGNRAAKLVQGSSGKNNSASEVCCQTHLYELFLHIVTDQVNAHPLLPVEQTFVSDLVGTCGDISAGCRDRAPCRDSAHVRERRRRKHRWVQDGSPEKAARGSWVS